VVAGNDEISERLAMITVGEARSLMNSRSGNTHIFLEKKKFFFQVVTPTGDDDDGGDDGTGNRIFKPS